MRRRRPGGWAVLAGVGVLAWAAPALAAPGATLELRDPNTARDMGHSSTYTSGTVRLLNTGDVAITGLRIDLATAALTDLVFDPADGTPAGDDVGRDVTVDGSSDVPQGAITPAYLAPQDDGFRVVDIGITGMTGGEDLVFGVDVDPTSTRGGIGTSDALTPPAAHVSGAELHGATVTVRFADGSTRTSSLGVMPQSLAGSNWQRAARAGFAAGAPAAPGLARAGGAASPATVTAAAQTVVVTGPPNTSGTVVVTEGHLNVAKVPAGGFDLDPWEANMAARFTEVPFTTGAGGTAQVALTLTATDPHPNFPGAADAPRDVGINLVTAHLTPGGVPGPVSAPLVMVLDPDGPPPSGSGAFLPSGGQVVMDAESFATNTPRGTDSWTATATPAGSVGTAMASGPDNGSSAGTPITTTSPELTFPVDFPSAGTWHVWVRGWNPDGAGNSVHLGLDGATQTASVDLTNTTYGAWTWFRGRVASPTARITVPSAGVHTVNVWMREDGFVLDRLLLTTSSTLTPSGAGPAESPRDGGGPSDTTPPSLTARTPAVGAVGVAVGANVTATFDEALAPASVTTSSVTLTPTAGGAAIPAAVSLGSGGTVITLNPTADLAAGTQYTATLTTAIEDVAGNNLPASINWSFTTAVSGPGPGSGAFLPSGGQVVMEAESFTTNTPRGTDSWTATATPAGSVGTAMASGPDDGSSAGTPITTTAPELTYPVSFPGAGTWHVWVRAWNPSTASNSVHLGLDGATQAASTDLTNNTFGSWVWFRGRTASPTARITVPAAGVRTVNVWMREDGLVLDRILLTTSSTYTPTGNGPAESPRS